MWQPWRSATAGRIPCNRRTQGLPLCRRRRGRLPGSLLFTPCTTSAPVGPTGFEPATSPTRTERATRLRHSPRRPKGSVAVRAGAALSPRIGLPCHTRGSCERAAARSCSPALSPPCRADRAPRRAPTEALGGRAAVQHSRSAAVAARPGSTSRPIDRGDRRRFVVERDGRILVVRGGRCCAGLFRHHVRCEQRRRERAVVDGVRPDYARSRRFYVYYTDNQGFIRVEQFSRARGTMTALPSSRGLVIRLPHRNHKGGQVQVGLDGYLYAAFGDGGGAAIRTARRSGSTPWRARSSGSSRAPAAATRSTGQPFSDRAGARGEIYAYGLRPYRFSFDRARGHLTVGDVGQDAVEEIDFVPNRRGRGRARAAATSAGACSRAAAGIAPGAARAPAAGDHALPGRRVLLDHRRLRDPRPLAGSPPARALPTAITATRSCAWRGCAAAARRPVRSACAYRLSVSFGEDGRGRVRRLAERIGLPPRRAAVTTPATSPRGRFPPAAWHVLRCRVHGAP